MFCICYRFAVYGDAIHICGKFWDSQYAFPFFFLTLMGYTWVLWYLVTQKLPQICTVILCSVLGRLHDSYYIFAETSGSPSIDSNTAVSPQNMQVQSGIIIHDHSACFIKCLIVANEFSREAQSLTK